MTPGDRTARPAPGSAVVFDFGAVLFQWRPEALLQRVVPELAPDPASARSFAAQIFQSFTPDSDWARFDLGLLEPDALATRIAARLKVPAAAIRAVIDAIPGHLVAQAEAVSLFRRLAAPGRRRCFLSNMPRSYADHLERENPFIAEFDDGIFSGRVGLMKPHEAIYALAERQFGLDPARTVFIDDHAGNVEQAHTRGWQAVQYRDAAQCEAALREGGWL